MYMFFEKAFLKTSKPTLPIFSFQMPRFFQTAVLKNTKTQLLLFCSFNYQFNQTLLKRELPGK